MSKKVTLCNSMEQLKTVECYVIEMRFKGYGKQEHLFGPTFYQTFRGRDVCDGQIVTGDICEARRFPTAASVEITVRHLLNNPSVCNDSLKSYDIFIRKLAFGDAKLARLSEHGQVSLSG